MFCILLACITVSFVVKDAMPHARKFLVIPLKKYVGGREEFVFV